MSEDFLHGRLDRVFRRVQLLNFYRKLAICWALATLAGLGLLVLQKQTGWALPLAFPLFAVLTAGYAIVQAVRTSRMKPDYRVIAGKIEQAHPELEGLLLTAVQQTRPAGSEPGYLQYRVLQTAVERSQESDWRDLVPASRLAWAQVMHWGALALFAVVLWGMGLAVDRGGPWWKPSVPGLVVNPGDTSIERGESLIVLARFGGVLPNEVNLVVNEANAPVRKQPLVKSLADPIFGGSTPELKNDLTYHLEYSGQRTRDYKVTVFEHPRLERADVQLTFPAYTSQPPKRIEDTRRISEVEGTRLDLSLQLNKPVKSAMLVARNPEKSEIPLLVTADKAVASLPQFPLVASQTYDLRLVDADGRANKVPTPIVIDVVPNRPPELKLALPRGDMRPSPLEEISFDGTIWDDFGVPAYGLSYTVAGGETKFIKFEGAVSAREKKPFKHVLSLEELGVQPEQLLSWYIWADDIGPDGKVRRTSGDLFFAEVRPFDEIFRESQDMPAPEGQQQGPAGIQARRLPDLQKQIISATWKLQRDPTTPKYADDASVVRQSQEEAMTLAGAVQEHATTPRAQALWSAVTKEMAEAITHLKAAAESPGPLASALAAEQSAYQALLKLQTHETQVARNRSRGGGQGNEQGTQRQLDQLDLTQSENRYETQRQASAPQSPERREQSQVMNRLQELARRQQDLNDRLKELQAGLEEAHTEQQKEEVRRQLKRLQEEQRQMLADTDELRQRMDRPENQSRLAEQRQQLDQARTDLQRAAEATGEGAVAQAVAAGTRAQRQLQQMRDELRKQNSNEYAEDVRQMREEARELSREQENVARKLGALDDERHKTLSDAGGRKELIDELDRQKARMKDVVDRATQISQQAESTEPLLAKQLYDSLRKLSQDETRNVKEFGQELLNSGIMTRDLRTRLQEMTTKDETGKSLDLTADMLREGYLPQASAAERLARSEIEDLKHGVEHAAESVLGDDTEALRLARSELDAVTEQLQREIAQAQRDQAPGQTAADEGRATTNTTDGKAERPGVANNEPREGGAPDAGERANGSNQSGDPATDGTPVAANSESSGNPMPGQTNTPSQGGYNPGSGQRLAGGNRGEEERGLNLDTLLNARAGGTWGPITGDDFTAWSDRLRDVEEVLDQPELRSAVAAARERARQARNDYRRELKKPDWAVVQLQIVKPLVEVRSRVAEELARREAKDPLVPLDRDPVPNRYAESVRKYFEELGKDK